MWKGRRKKQKDRISEVEKQKREEGSILEKKRNVTVNGDERDQGNCKWGSLSFVKNKGEDNEKAENIIFITIYNAYKNNRMVHYKLKILT